MADLGQGAQSIGYQYVGFGNRSRLCRKRPARVAARKQTGYFL